MTFGIVPVKDLSKAKERLSSVLPQKHRTTLAYAMLEDVLIALKNSKLLDRKFIITLDKGAIEIASNLGIEIIVETEQNGESASVDFAAAKCIEMGADSMLVIPGDAPLITSSDIDKLVSEQKQLTSPYIIMVPAGDELGTNAILKNPPDIIPSRFGHDSYNKHKEEANNKNIPYKTFKNVRIALDIDQPADLQMLINQIIDSNTKRELINLGIISQDLNDRS
ncbi:MAG: 2-phospho-L-lactate guanylyltransferase [Candidatus Dadabacteria bacterium]|nr:2-phospho-L-lactate guanylyltransferase [Candidatus Dadabacteria bacterium]NIV41690.1 2-phospho-L-lactate guanylyltransferase [Candidatus Dadabacteria bacterium]NIX16309.1 2-phospho-L-lactate guanylyltransferase [Candidatus Dadabacteria bacterium]